MEKIKVAVKRIGEAVKLIEINNSLDDQQKIVGGYLETLYLEHGIILVCNEEGKREGLEPNLKTSREVIVGDVFFTKSSGNDFVSLNDLDYRYIQCGIVGGLLAIPYLQ